MGVTRQILRIQVCAQNYWHAWMWIALKELKALHVIKWPFLFHYFDQFLFRCFDHLFLVAQVWPPLEWNNYWQFFTQVWVIHTCTVVTISAGRMFHYSNIRLLWNCIWKFSHARTLQLKGMYRCCCMQRISQKCCFSAYLCKTRT